MTPTRRAGCAGGEPGPFSPRFGPFGAWRGAPWRGPLERSLVRAGVGGAGLCAALALTGAAMRVVPMTLGDVPVAVTLPFARAVASVAVEAAILVGWPVGWALGAYAFCERGEARVLSLLGRGPARSIAGALPLALVFAVSLGCASALGGRDANEPGRVASELVEDARRACAHAPAPTSTPVPLVGASWLCAGGVGRLVSSPFGSSDALLTAKGVRIAPDARDVTLDDAWLALGDRATVHVGRATFHLPPFVRASPLPAWGRALVLGAAGVVAALVATWAVLVLAASRDVEPARAMNRLHAFALGAVGPVAVLTSLRALDRAGAPAAAFAALPLVSLVGVMLAFVIVKTLPRLIPAGTKLS